MATGQSSHSALAEETSWRANDLWITSPTDHISRTRRCNLQQFQAHAWSERKEPDVIDDRIADGPNDRVISAIRSWLPVSMTTISTNSPRTDSRHLGAFFSSSLAITVR